MKRSAYVGSLLIALFWMGLGYFSLETCGQAAYVGLEIIQPKQIQVGSFFNGEEVSVKAIFPCDCDLALRIWGPREDLKLMRKGRVGRLWMNVEQITFANIPKAYLLWTSKKPAEGGGKILKELKFDYASVLAGSLQGKKPEEEQFLIQELVKLKEHDNLYHISEGTIRTQPLGKGSLSQAEVGLHLPAKIHPGSYTLELIAFTGGKSTLLKAYPLKVQLTGLPAALSNLATQNGVLFGVLAVAIAALGGLVMGIFFSSRGAH
jgi:hypothetical protein